MKIRKMRGKQIICLILTFCMLVQNGMPALASEELPGEEEAGFSFGKTDAEFSEGDGRAEIPVIRTGDISKAASVTITAYDFSAKYAEDYVLSAEGVTVSENKDAVSLYEAFQEDGFTIDTELLSESMCAFPQEDSEELGSKDTEEVEDQSSEDAAGDASEDLSKILKQIGTKSAEMTIDFAAGEQTRICSLDLVEDEESEYTEYFILTLSSESGLGANWEMTGSITDNEETAPENTVSFVEDTVEIEGETSTAKLQFQREGRLDVFSTALLLKDGEAYGYLNFNPYQEEQIANVPEGTYQLDCPVNCQVVKDIVAVSSNVESKTEEGKPLSKEETKEPENENLDQIPQYSKVTERSGTALTKEFDSSWISEWAKNGSSENEDSYIVMGSANRELFDEDRHEGYGKSKFMAENNCYELETSGSFSCTKKSNVYIKSIEEANFTGIESVTGCFDVAGLQNEAKIHFGASGLSSTTEVVDTDDKGEITFQLPEKCKTTSEIYYANIDPSNFDDGCQIYALNGYRLNKREYYVAIDTPDALPYTDKNVAATINGNSTRMYKKVGDGTSTMSKIPIVFNTSDYPQKMVGYRLINNETNKISDEIKANGTDTIAFDRAFIEAYERDYFYEAKDEKGKAYSTFTIKPVMEKIPVEKYSLEESSFGTIKVTNADSKNKLYQGDIAILEEDESEPGYTLEGVYVKARSAGNYEWISGTKNKESDGTVRVRLNARYDEYVFQGVYSKDADVLTINYASGAREHGTLAGQEGVAVGKSEYVINDFYPLTAKADEGYVTKWTSDSRTYYGDVFYYQLDGNADHNRFSVDFVKETQETGDIHGDMKVTDVNLHNGGLSSSHPLEYKEFSATSSVNYSGTSEKDGVFNIPKFKGVKGGTYSIAIINGDIYSYLTFEFGDPSTYQLKVPQFGPGIFFPASVDVSLDGADSGDNKIQLREESYVETTVNVYNQVNSPYDIKKVELKYYGEDENGAIANLVQTVEAQKTGESEGNYTKYVAKVQASTLPQNTRLYAEVVGSREIDVNGSPETIEVRSGEVNSGYELITPIKDTSIPVHQDVPIVPGAQSALNVSLSDLDIPLIGSLDFGVSSKAGAFFIRQPDVNDPSVYYLMAGYSVNSVWGLGTPVDKYESAKATKDSLFGSANNTTPAGDAAEVGQAVTSTPVNEPDQVEAGDEKKPSMAEKYGLNTKFGIYPLGMIKLGFKTTAKENGDTSTDLSLYELVLGIDAHMVINKPFVVYGVPCYGALNMDSESYVQVQQNVNTENSGAVAGGDLEQVLVNAGETDSQVNSFISIPQSRMGVKLGAGMNNLVGVYGQGTINTKLNFQMTPDCDAGGSLQYDLTYGADVLVLNGSLTFSLPTLKFGNDTLRDQLEMFSSAMSAKQSQQMKNLTFSLVDRPGLASIMQSERMTSSTLMERAFKHTKVKMIPLGNGSILAVVLADNGAEEGSANFLSVTSAISNDQGKTWEKIKAVSPSESLQFAFETYELNDRILVTWSEGDLDQRLNGMDKSKLNASQVAQALDEMDLKGCYFEKSTGEVLGESFTIEEDTGVAMSALSAMQKDDGSVAVYYTRAQYPTKEGMSVEDLMAQEKTIACAVSNTDGTWNSHGVEAHNDQRNQTYRVLEVQPFSHDGITGEVLVVDRDGKLVVKDANSGEMIPSIEDRQIYLRIHTGTDLKETSSLIPLTSAEGCAQDIQVVKSRDSIYLFWNQDGRIVYLSNFVVSNDASEVEKSGAVAVVDKTTKEVTIPDNVDGVGSTLVASGSTLKVQSDYAISMSEEGEALLSWIAEESQGNSEETKLFSNDEIYGVALKEVTNGDTKTLESVGNPVALTDENSVLGRTDSLYISKDQYLLGYSKLDGDTIQDSKQAEICTSEVAYQPKLSITDIQTPVYPMPGSDMTVQATIRNDGLVTLAGSKMTVSGLGSGAQESSTENILPGCEEKIAVTVKVPKDFAKDTTLKLTASGVGDQSSNMAEEEANVLYGSYFVPRQMARLSSITDTKKYLSELTVANIGNAAGIPEASYDIYIPGSDDESKHKIQDSSCKTEVAPGESAKVTEVVEDTISTKDQQSQMQITLGDGYDQGVEGVIPAALISKTEKEPEQELDCKTHSYKNVVTPATPQEDGKIVEVCSVCGKTGKTTVIPHPKEGILSHTSYTYNGKAKKPSVTIKDKAGNIISPADYKVSYQKGRKKVGKYLVTVTFTGKNYSGQMTETFTVRPKGTSLKELQAEKGGFTAIWKKQTVQTTGYEISYSTSKAFDEKKTKKSKISKKGRKKETITNLEENKTYYVKIRTYKKTGNKKIHSKWSSVEKVKTKNNAKSK